MFLSSLADRVDAVTSVALEDLAPLWQLQPTDVAEALLEVLPPLLDQWADAAATLAADWYDDLRDELNIGGSFTAIVPDLADMGVEALAGWAGEALLAPEPDFVLARERVAGGTQRRIANAARDVVMTSSVADPKARGWKRVVRPGACGFCRMLAARGYAYKTRESSTFGSHDHCSCSAAPGWSTGKPVKVRDYTPSADKSTKAERQAADKWIKENLPIA